MSKSTKQILTSIVVCAVIILPQVTMALEMPGINSSNSTPTTDAYNLTARAYLVLDKSTGQILVSKNADTLWVPASLTKLVTALVVMDTKPNLLKTVTMKAEDEVGGVRIATKAGITYRVQDLLYATLVASANNATNALSRSTGLSHVEFVDRMNKKARDLGAIHTTFLEPTGISERNITTAEDFAKISKAAFENSQMRRVLATQNYNFGAVNSKKYYHRIKSTNKLLADTDMTRVGGKTGFLYESLYNFTAEVSDKFGNNMFVVLLGSQNSTTQFRETKELVALGGLAKVFKTVTSAVLGQATSTPQ
jgi:D-alanyl-D-alanine carboxypeptidase (penicillin-binding protein 5/6)